MYFQLRGVGDPDPCSILFKGQLYFSKQDSGYGRKRLFYPRQRPRDRIWFCFFYSAYLISALRGAVFLLTHLTWVWLQWDQSKRGPCAGPVPCKLYHSNTLKSLESLWVSFTSTCKDKELWFGSGQNGIEIHNSVVPGVRLVWKQNRAKVHFPGTQQYLLCFPHFFLPPI